MIFRQKNVKKIKPSARRLVTCMYLPLLWKTWRALNQRLRAGHARYTTSTPWLR